MSCQNRSSAPLQVIEGKGVDPNPILSDGATPTILLIDDDIVFSRWMKDLSALLKIAMHSVYSADDLDRCRNLKIDVALIDYDLGGATGFDAAERVLSEFGGIPVVLISGQAQLDLQWFLGEQIYGFIHKIRGPQAMVRAAVDAFQCSQASALPL